MGDEKNYSRALDLAGCHGAHCFKEGSFRGAWGPKGTVFEQSGLHNHVRSGRRPSLQSGAGGHTLDRASKSTRGHTIHRQGRGPNQCGENKP